MITRQLQKDIEYIKNEIISKQPNGNYTKFSLVDDFIAFINEPKEKSYKYWTSQYKSSEEELDLITKTLDEKFKNGLTPIEKMIKYIQDARWEPERDRAIKYLKGELK